MNPSSAPDGGARLRRIATTASLTVALTLVAAKLTAWIVTDSIAVLSSLVDSLGDVAASLITMISVRQALRPPDRSHRYGHGKAESLGALAQTAFIAGSGLFVVVQAIARLLEPEPVEQSLVAILVMAGSVAMILPLVLFQRRVIRATGSVAVDADRLNYSGDLLTGTAVLATLIVGRWLTVPWLDPVAGLAVAVFLLVNAGRIALSALDILMDRELPAAERRRIADVVLADPRVLGLHDLRSRHAGTCTFIELHLELDGQLTLNEAHAVADDVERALTAAFPGSEVLLHQEPHGLIDERLDHRLASG